jgi:hypothetical protein
MRNKMKQENRLDHKNSNPENCRNYFLRSHPTYQAI